MSPLERQLIIDKIKARAIEEGAPDEACMVADLVNHMLELLERIANKRGNGDID